jgi:hypothetical protein
MVSVMQVGERLEELTRSYVPAYGNLARANIRSVERSGSAPHGDRKDEIIIERRAVCSHTQGIRRQGCGRYAIAQVSHAF